VERRATAGQVREACQVRYDRLLDCYLIGSLLGTLFFLFGRLFGLNFPYLDLIYFIILINGLLVSFLFYKRRE
jgi:hypothetical protein